MGSIKLPFIKIFFACVLACLAAPCLFAQSQGTLLGTEIQNLEKKLGKNTNAAGSAPVLSNTERHEALIRLASLLELSGNIEGAERTWAEAAVSGDDLSLMRGAYCLAAMGEWEKADTAVRKALLSGRPGPALSMARFLGAVIEGRISSNTSALTALLTHPDFTEQRPAICYTLWKLTGAESWKTRLLEEFPRSPEGRIAAGAAISAAPTAFWLLRPGREGFTLAPSQKPAQSAASPVSGSAAQAAGSAAAASPSAASSSSTASKTAAAESDTSAILQTGLFGREENAKAQADRLKAAGFSPLINIRKVNGSDYWVVGVSPGQNMNQMILRLKDAGFESFPVFNQEK
ncbi:MAG: SPOR domain-containing protein [Treponema sp.]|jgi:hypothetical protein|nr:SPOR domain-containing protein [Treponema sp.]